MLTPARKKRLIVEGAILVLLALVGVLVLVGVVDLEADAEPLPKGDPVQILATFTGEPPSEDELAESLKSDGVPEPEEIQINGQNVEIIGPLGPIGAQNTAEVLVDEYGADPDSLKATIFTGAADQKQPKKPKP